VKGTISKFDINCKGIRELQEIPATNGIMG
jgi:hypothetical protein